MKRKLIIVEGFDRIGKDTFLSKTIPENELYTYIQNNTPPHYRDKEGFRLWLVDFLKKQADLLVNTIADNIIMARLFTSDYVYSKLFDRKMSTDYPYKVLSQEFDIYQVIFLYNKYDDYVDRCHLLGCEQEYNEEEFNKIQNYYKESVFNDLFTTKIFYNPTKEFTDELNYVKEILNNDK